MHFQFQSLADFISMGGHGGYVWSCYLLTLLIFTVLACWPLLKKRQLMVRIKDRKRIELRQQ